MEAPSHPGIPGRPLELALFSEKLHRFGAVGVGVIPDSSVTLRLASAGQEAQARASVGASLRSGERPADASSLTRPQILEILAETLRVQGIVQEEVSVLARKFAKEAADKKKKKKRLSFMEGHSKIQELNLPREPLEDFGLSDSAFQRLLFNYEEDEEVMAAAQKLLHPMGKGDPERARSISRGKIIEIHQLMVVEMQKVLEEFLQLPQDVRRSCTGKSCETTAELLVSIAVEQQLGVRCEDIEQAVILHEEALQQHPEFTRCTDQLASMMQHLIGAAQPRMQKEEFLQLLRHMGASNKKAKAFAKSLYDDVRAKSCNLLEAYSRFKAFSDELAGASSPTGEEQPDLSSTEMQLCYDEYRDDEEVRVAWEQAGVESNVMVRSMMMMNGPRSTSSSSSAAEDKKGGKKLKSSEIVEMQELMVDKLSTYSQAAADALKTGPGVSQASEWRAEVAVQLMQALASAAVEHRYGTSAEEMTMAGFRHAATLQKNERFVRATERQQEILMTVARLCVQES